MNYGEFHHNWKGGGYSRSHVYARKLYEPEVRCYLCGVTDKEHRQKTGFSIDIHCHNGRHEIIDKMFWTPLCRRCHKMWHLDVEGYTTGRVPKNRTLT